jgi:hypothetical protein
VAGEDLITTGSMHDPVGVRCTHDMQVLRHARQFLRLACDSHQACEGRPRRAGRLCGPRVACAGASPAGARGGGLAALRCGAPLVRRHAGRAVSRGSAGAAAPAARRIPGSGSGKHAGAVESTREEFFSRARLRGPQPWRGAQPWSRCTGATAARPSAATAGSANRADDRYGNRRPERDASQHDVFGEVLDRCQRIASIECSPARFRTTHCDWHVVGRKRAAGSSGGRHARADGYVRRAASPDARVLLTGR